MALPPDRTAALATAIVLVSGAVWGLYWLPVRALSDLGLPGPWGTLAITFATVLLLLPVAALRHRRIRRANRIAVASVALGGAAFALYSIGFVYGRVAIIILLYFLTPVWSTLIGRYVMGWDTTPMRLAAIAVGLLGLGVMLGAQGDLPLPRSIGEWMALMAGVFWSLSTTGIRAKSDLAPAEAAFVFACGAALSSAVLALILQPLPAADLLARLSAPHVLALACFAGGAWWALSIATLMWAATRLEPARVGILLMAEVLVGAASAALLAGETLHPLEIAGGALVLLSGVLEIWPTRPRRA